MLAKLRAVMLQHNPHHTTALYTASVIGVITVAVALVVWQLFNDRARERLDAVTDYSGRAAALLIQENINNRLLSLDRLAHRWSAAGGISRPVWEADVAVYLEDMPGLATIAWADANLRTRWVMPSTETTGGQSPINQQPEPLRSALEQARKQRRILLSKPFELATGDTAIAIVTPVKREQKFDGVIFGVLHLQPWLDHLFAKLGYAKHNFYVLASGREVYSNHSVQHSMSRNWASHHVFENNGITWHVIVTPTKTFVSEIHAHTPTLNLLVGLLASILITFLVYLVIMYRLRKQQLQSTAHQLASVFHNLPGMAYRCTNQAKSPMAFVSEGCERLSGYSPHDFSEKRVVWRELIHPQDSDRVWQSMQQSIGTSKTHEVEYRIITKDNEERWVWERGWTIPSKQDNNVCLEGLVIDITGKKRAEIALIEARKFSEAVIETAAEAVITTDIDGSVERFNRAAQQMFGYSLAEVEGQNFHQLITSKSWKKYDQYIQSQNLEKANKRGIGDSFEINARHKSGQVFPIRLSISAVRFNPAQKFVILIRDVSQQRAAEFEARQLREHLAHVDRLNILGEMAAGIAHEINQPLTAISLFAQTGARLYQSKKYDRIPGIFEKLSQQALRAGAVIERMQTMAQQRESTREVVDCKPMVDDIVNLAQTEAHLRGITINVETACDLPKVAVDVVQIQQVVLNLLRNGMEAMQEVGYRDGNTIHLQTRRGDGNNIEVAVIDSGCGVSEEAANNLFTPFATTKESGLGMGLSICRAIITAHGGQLVFHNNPLGGATFLFTLPVAESGDQNG